MTRPRVSVVTPVYNGGPWLDECIESVRAQTHPDWDLTIVDNCSTDRTPEIAARHAAADSRIRVLHNEVFLDQVANLNKAIAQSDPESRYTKVVLADDWLFPRCLEEMVAVAERHPRVGIVSSYRLDDARITCDGLPYPSPVVPGREIARRSLLEDFFVFGSPTTLLFRHEVVRARRPFYSTESLHEDTEACYEILQDWDFGFVHQVLSFTRRQNDSITAARHVIDPLHLLDRLIVTMKFGPKVLSEAELTECRRRRERVYYQFLGERALYQTGERFWRYHREGLATVGLELDRLRLGAAVGRAALLELRDPVAVARRVYRQFGRVFARTFAGQDEPGRTGGER